MGKEPYKNFKIQIKTDIIRDPDIYPFAFVLYGKLVHMYHYNGRNKELEIDKHMLMYHLNIKENRTFKKALTLLYNKRLILNDIKRLNEKITIVLNEEIISFKAKSNPFTQLTYKIFNQTVIKKIGFHGCKLLYYYRSYINNYTGKDFCYTSEETISKETGMDEKTIRKYNKILSNLKYIKIDKHKLSANNEYINRNGIDMLFFTKYNNHYYVLEHNIEKE